jgi:hypothetical protein
MQQIILDAEAGQISAELTRRGVAADTRVHVLVEVLDPAEPPMTAIAQASKAFDWLADEPDLYSDADPRSDKRPRSPSAPRGDPFELLGPTTDRR